MPIDWVRTALRMEKCSSQLVAAQCPELALIENRPDQA